MWYSDTDANLDARSGRENSRSLAVFERKLGLSRAVFRQPGGDMWVTRVGIALAELEKTLHAAGGSFDHRIPCPMAWTVNWRFQPPVYPTNVVP